MGLIVPIFYLIYFFVFNQAAGLAPSMEQIEMLSEQLPKASLLKLYVSQQDSARNIICICTNDSERIFVLISNQICVITRFAKLRYQT